MSAQDLSNLLSLQSLLPQARQAGGNLQAELQQQVIAQRAQQAIMGAAGMVGARNSALISGLQPGGTGMGLPAGFSAAQAQSSLSPIGSSHQRWPQHQVSRANLHTLQHAAAVQAGQRLPQLPQGHDSRMHGMQAQLSVQQSTQIPMHPGFMRTAELPQKPEPSQQQRALEDDLVALHPEKKVDKSVPATVETLVPEAKLYSRLLRVEALLDRESAKQAWEVEDALRDKPSLLRTLRMTVCNTHKNQPAMARSAAAKQADSAEGHGETAHGGADCTQGHGGGAPEWTLHIMGDALGVEKSSQKLSDFLEMIEVNLPEDSCQRDRKFIWVAGSGQTDTESIDLLCLGDKEFEVDITLWCKQSVQKFVTKNSTFGAALGITRASTKDEWIQAFWTYIKSRRLHDPQDILSIKLDDALKDVFLCDTIPVSQFGSMLDKLLVPAPATQVHIKHRLSLSSAELQPTVADVTISIASERAIPIRDFSESNAKIDAKLEQTMKQIATKKKRRDFMQVISESPVVALNQMLESINASVQELKHSDLMRLPVAKPLLMGAGSDGVSSGLLTEERSSAFWGWSGFEKMAGEMVAHRPPEMSQNGSAENTHSEEGKRSKAAHSIEHEVAQPSKPKKQKKSGDELPGLDPGQALQNLMMRGPHSKTPKSNPAIANSDLQAYPSHGSNAATGSMPLTPHASIQHQHLAGRDVSLTKTQHDSTELNKRIQQEQQIMRQQLETQVIEELKVQLQQRRIQDQYQSLEGQQALQKVVEERVEERYQRELPGLMQRIASTLRQQQQPVQQLVSLDDILRHSAGSF